MNPETSLDFAVLQGLQKKVGFDAADVEDVVTGCGTGNGEHAHDIGRSAVLDAGWPLTATGVISDVGRRGLFYVDELCRCWNLTAQQRQVMALYAALFATDFVRRIGRDQPDEWLDRMRGAIERWTTIADQQP